MTKKIFIISLIVFLIAGTYLFVQFFLFREKPVSQDDQIKSSKSSLGSEKMNSLDGKLEKVIEGNIKSPIINADGDKILYFNQNNFLSSSLDGSIKAPLGSYPFKEVTGVEWSFDRKNVIVNDSGEYYIFNIESSDAKTFKSNADNLVWGTVNDQVVYKFYDSVTKKIIEYLRFIWFKMGRGCRDSFSTC